MENNFGENTLENMNQAVWYNQWTLSKFTRFLTGDILEVGCGIGNFTKSLIKYGQVRAVDIDNNYLKQTNEIVGDTAQVGFGDIEKGSYFFKDKKFNTIVCLNVLEHINNDSKALINLYKLLKNGGYLILLVPSHPKLFGSIDKMIGHFRRYTKDDISKKLKEANFSIMEIKRLNFLGAIGWFFAGKFFKSNTVSKNKIRLFNLLSPIVLPIENLIEPSIGTSILVIAEKKL